jgi:hypothetical protein
VNLKVYQVHVHLTKLSHGFSVELIQDVVERCNEIFSVEDIISSFPVFALVHAIRILEVFQELFDIC